MTHFYPTLIIGLCYLLAYLMGSIPFGLILGKLFGAGDIRKIGSGNIGATNMLRTGSKKLAAATLLLDFAKGFIGVALALALSKYYYANQGGDFVTAPASIIYIAGFAAVIGHVFPVWLKFKGGKGVATTLGVFFAIQPLIGFLTAIGWLTIFYLTRVSSLAAMASIFGAPILGYADTHDIRFTIMAAMLATLVIYKHKDNIKRLREGTEKKVGTKTDAPT